MITIIIVQNRQVIGLLNLCVCMSSHKHVATGITQAIEDMRYTRLITSSPHYWNSQDSGIAQGNPRVCDSDSKQLVSAPTCTIN